MHKEFSVLAASLGVASGVCAPRALADGARNVQTEQISSSGVMSRIRRPRPTPQPKQAVSYFTCPEANPDPWSPDTFNTTSLVNLRGQGRFVSVVNAATYANELGGGVAWTNIPQTPFDTFTFQFQGPCDGYSLQIMIDGVDGEGNSVGSAVSCHWEDIFSGTVTTPNGTFQTVSLTPTYAWPEGIAPAKITDIHIVYMGYAPLTNTLYTHQALIGNLELNGKKAPPVSPKIVNCNF